MNGAICGSQWLGWDHRFAHVVCVCCFACQLPSWPSPEPSERLPRGQAWILLRGLAPCGKTCGPRLDEVGICLSENELESWKGKDLLWMCSNARLPFSSHSSAGAEAKGKVRRRRGFADLDGSAEAKATCLGLEAFPCDLAMSLENVESGSIPKNMEGTCSKSCGIFSNIFINIFQDAQNMWPSSSGMASSFSPSEVFGRLQRQARAGAWLRPCLWCSGSCRVWLWQTLRCKRQPTNQPTTQPTTNQTNQPTNQPLYINNAKKWMDEIGLRELPEEIKTMRNM